MSRIIVWVMLNFFFIENDIISSSDINIVGSTSRRKNERFPLEVQRKRQNIHPRWTNIYVGWKKIWEKCSYNFEADWKCKNVQLSSFFLLIRSRLLIHARLFTVLAHIFNKAIWFDVVLYSFLYSGFYFFSTPVKM